jgi:hypothetical protein
MDEKTQYEILSEKAVLFAGIMIICFVFSFCTFLASLVGDGPLVVSIISFIAGIFSLMAESHYDVEALDALIKEHYEKQTEEALRQKRIEPFRFR